MIGLSIAVGRFVEALFWGMFRVAGGLALIAVAVAVLVIAMLAVGSRIVKRRR